MERWTPTNLRDPVPTPPLGPAAKIQPLGSMEDTTWHSGNKLCDRFGMTGMGQVLWHIMTLWITDIIRYPWNSMDIYRLVTVWYLLHPWPCPTPCPIPSWSVRRKMWLSPSRRTRKARNAVYRSTEKGNTATVSRVARYRKLRLFRTKSTHFLSANFCCQPTDSARSEQGTPRKQCPMKGKLKYYNILQPMTCFVAEKKQTSTRRTTLPLSWHQGLVELSDLTHEAA
jgi:hypothetical protein